MAAIFLICIAERNSLLDPAKENWFTLFRIIFECTSAYATIGLSTGVPYDNYSFVGGMRTLSKLIVSVVRSGSEEDGLTIVDSGDAAR